MMIPDFLKTRKRLIYELAEARARLRDGYPDYWTELKRKEWYIKMSITGNLIELIALVWLIF